MLRAFVLLLCATTLFAETTFTRDVAPIVQNKCQLCHRPSDIAPFALSTYDDAVTWAADIKRVIENRIMPPWKPVPGHGEFKNNFGLTEEERATILNWIEGGTLEGDPADLPERPVESSKWQLGDPDHVISMAEPYSVPRAKDVYRCFVIPSGVDTDKYLTAVQVAPGNRGLVHHVILYVDSTGSARKLDAQDDEPGYKCFGGPGFDFGFNITSLLTGTVGAIGAWVPGMRASFLPDGVGIFVPKNTDIVMEVHYFPNGRPGEDQSEIGFYWAKEPVNKRFRFIPFVDLNLNIPPGEKAHQEGTSAVIPPLLDMTAITVGGHMHRLGRKVKVERTDRSGETSSLLYINDWDFNWQNFYQFAEPVKLPAGTRVKLTCEYDNSEENPNNPNNPLKTVRWGESTEDEMCIAVVGVTFDLENLAPQISRK